VSRQHKHHHQSITSSKRPHVANSEGRPRQASRLDSVVKKSHSASPRRSFLLLLSQCIRIATPSKSLLAIVLVEIMTLEMLSDRFVMRGARIVLLGISPIGEKSAVGPRRVLSIQHQFLITCRTEVTPSHPAARSDEHPGRSRPAVTHSCSRYACILRLSTARHPIVDRERRPGPVAD
jgi:hypothetical protein